MNKWRVFHTPILVGQDFIDDIVKTCCILHNFVRAGDGVNYVDAHPFEHVRNLGIGPRGQGHYVQNAFADFFIGKGPTCKQLYI